MGTKVQKLSDQLRRAIDTSGKSRYRICKDIGISESLMSRFMAGKCNLSLAVLDRLCEYLGLELRKSKRKGR